MTYRVEVAPAAVRQLRKLDPSARRRVQAAIELLAEQPRPSGAKKLVGGDGEWQVRAGDYRVVYEIHGEMLRVLVVAIGHRWDIYQRRSRTPASSVMSSSIAPPVGIAVFPDLPMSRHFEADPALRM